MAIDGGIVLGLERLDAIREIDVLDEVAVVEAGVITADLSAALAPEGFFYAPDPASDTISTLGGNIATNAGGMRCAKYGVTRESVLALEAVLADGTLLRTGHRSLKGVTGLDLTQLLIGSEGTLAVIVAATVRIHPLPTARRTVLARFPTTAQAVGGVNAISRSPVRPAATELLDAGAVADIDALGGSSLGGDGTGAVLLLELDGYGIEEQTTESRRGPHRGRRARAGGRGGAGGRATVGAAPVQPCRRRRPGPARRGRRGAEVAPRGDVHAARGDRQAPRRGHLGGRPRG